MKPLKPTPLTRDLEGLCDGAPPEVHSRTQLLGLCRSLGLCFHRTLALSLKFDSERQTGAPPEGGIEEKAAWVRRGEAFRPETHELLALFDQNGIPPTREGYSPAAFAHLVNEIVRDRIHLVSPTSPEMRIFLDRRAKLGGAAAEVCETHLERKSEWSGLEAEFRDLAWSLESQRLANAHVNREFLLSVFGESYLPLQEEAERVRALRRCLELKVADTLLTREELQVRMVHELELQQRSLEDLRALAGQPCAQLLEGAGNPSISAEELSYYESDCKAVLRAIYKLAHPDRRPRTLSPRQEEMLDSLWEQVMRIRPNELGFHPGQLGYQHRQMDALLCIKQRIESVLESAGLETETMLSPPPGSTPEAEIEWYVIEIRFLRDEIRSTRAQLKVILEDPVIQERRGLLALPEEERERVVEQMVRKTEEYRAEAEKLEERLDELFGEEGRP